MKWLSKSWAVAAVLLVGCAGRQEFIPPEPNAEEYAPPNARLHAAGNPIW